MNDLNIDLIVSRWRDGALAELDAAKILLAAEKNRQAMFWLHLTLEKALKAHVVKVTRQHAPFTHSLPRLIKLAQLNIPAEWYSVIDEINIFQIEARYEDFQSEEIIAVDQVYASTLLGKGEMIVQWLIKEL